MESILHFHCIIFALFNGIPTQLPIVQSKQVDNNWKKPYHVFGPGEASLRKQIIRQVPDYIFDDIRDIWLQKRTDKFLSKLLEKVTEKAQKYNGEFEIDKTFLKQASARQGLKITAPDEYDVIIPFKMKGLDFQTSKVRDSEGKIIPGIVKQRVLNTGDIQRNNPELSKKGVFRMMNGGNTVIDTKNFHERVWIKIFDQAIDSLKKEMPDVSMVRRNNPPAINLQTTDAKGKVTNFDLVPAHHTETDRVTVPASVTGKKDKVVEFPIYHLLKYDNKNNPLITPEDRSVVWRECTSSYERYMSDLCKSSPERQYIMTANRILKSAIKDLNEKQNPLGQLLTSYHLKTVAFHCVAQLTLPGSKTKLTGVKDALGHQIKFLSDCVRKEYLPDFFHGNRYLEKIFPGSKVTENHREQNLFWKSNPLQVKSAKHGIPQLMKNLDGCFTPFDEQIRSQHNEL